MKYEKYNMVVICPTLINGSSTGFMPIHVSIMAEARNVTDIIWGIIFMGLYFLGLNDISIKIAAARAITPPILFGIDRRMA